MFCVAFAWYQVSLFNLTLQTKLKEALDIGDRQVPTMVHQFPIFKENRQNKYRRNFLSQRVCICWNKLLSNLVAAGTLNEFKSRPNAHFAISPLQYDHKARWDSLEGLDARSLHIGAAGSRVSSLVYEA